MGQRAVQQGFFQALVGIFVLHILADQPDFHLILGVLQPLQHAGPAPQIAVVRRFQLHQAQDGLVDPLFGENQRHFVHRRHVPGRDHRIHVHVAEQRDLLLHFMRQRAFGAAQQHIRLNADGPQFLHAMLGRLRFEFLRGRDPRHQGHVQEQRILAAKFVPQLADGFEKRERFDVAHGPSDFDDRHIHAMGHLVRRGLDLVRHVRNHLHRFAQVIAAPLPMDDLFVDPSRRQIIGLGKNRVGEAFVVPEVQIGLRAVVGDEHLAVLERAHRAGIDVEVRIELLKGYAQPPAFQQAADRSRRDALSQGGNHAAGNEYEFGHGHFHLNRVASNMLDTRSRSSGVSTPSESYSVSATWMRWPFSSARSCSRHSADSSGPTGRSQ